MARRLVLSSAVSSAVWIVVSLALLSCVCGCRTRTDPRPEPFRMPAAASSWTMNAGSCFYRFDERMDCLLLPKPDAPAGPIEFTQARTFRSFQYSAAARSFVVEGDDLDA